MTKLVIDCEKKISERYAKVKNRARGIPIKLTNNNIIIEIGKKNNNIP
jgi:hypothetical protein